MIPREKWRQRLWFFFLGYGSTPWIFLMFFLFLFWFDRNPAAKRLGSTGVNALFFYGETQHVTKTIWSMAIAQHKFYLDKKQPKVCQTFFHVWNCNSNVISCSFYFYLLNCFCFILFIELFFPAARAGEERAWLVTASGAGFVQILFLVVSNCLCIIILCFQSVEMWLHSIFVHLQPPQLWYSSTSSHSFLSLKHFCTHQQ